VRAGAGCGWWAPGAAAAARVAAAGARTLGALRRAPLPGTRRPLPHPDRAPPPPPSTSGILSEIILPKYDVCNYGCVSELRLLRVMDVTFDGRRVPTRVWSGVVEG
jgi:hypothetical protein